MIVDPLAPGQDENPPAVQQPTASVNPFFDTGNLALGLFGSGWGNGGNATQRVAVAVGGGQVWVMAGGSSGKLVYNYDTVSLTPGHDEAGTANDIPASWSTGLTTLRNIAFYRGEVYVLGADGGTTLVKVFTPKGTLVRTLRPNLPAVPIVEESFTGLEVAWGELWLSRPDNNTANARDILGQELAVFDATTGAFKGLSRHPLSDTRQTAARGWWDIAVVPEYRGAIVDRRMFARGSLLPGIATPDSEGCTTGMLYACASGEQRGTDSPWGMRWFLELWAGTTNATYRPIKEFAIEKRSVVPQAAALDPITDALGPLGTSGYYVTQKREWVPYMEQVQGDPHSLSDVAYNNRELRIDWYGDLAKTHWQRGDRQCVHYIVSDADVFIVGAKGERRYELARGFEQIGYRIAKPGGAYGPLQDVRTGITNAAGDFCIDTTALDASGQRKTPDGVNKILLEAKVGSRTITVENTQLRVDNEKPAGSLDAPPEFVRAETTLLGTITDTWSGPKTATVDVRGADGVWKTVCDAAPLIDPALGRYACTWNTAAKDTDNPDPTRRNDRVYPDGRYEVRATLRDRSLGTMAREGETGPQNNRSEVIHSTTVDNLPPDLTNFAPALGEFGFDVVDGRTARVEATATDAMSGMDHTTFFFNTATDGQCDGSWQQIGVAAGSGEVAASWDTVGLRPGLKCLAATGRDRAGNERQWRWQALLASSRPPDTQVTPSRSTRWYAGLDIGKYYEYAQKYRGWGASAILRTPAPLSDERNEVHEAHFTAARVAHGSTAGHAAEVGLLTELACGTVPGYGPGHPEHPDPWVVYGTFSDRERFEKERCIDKTLADPSPGQTFAVRTTVFIERQLLREGMYWRPTTTRSDKPIRVREVFTDVEGNPEGNRKERIRSTYRVRRAGGLPLQAMSETSHTARPMMTHYSSIRWRKRGERTYRLVDGEHYSEIDPEEPEYDRDKNDPYDRGDHYGIGLFAPHRFCTFGPKSAVTSCAF